MNRLLRHGAARAGALLLGAAFLTATPALAAKLKVTESADFDAPPAEIWKRIGDFGNLGWHPVVASTEIIKGKDNHRGAVRSIKTKDGAEIVEELMARSNAHHSYRYRILKSPLPVANYVSVLSVKAHGKGSRVTWSSSFDRSAEAKKSGVTPDKAKEVIAGIYRGGFDGLKTEPAAH